MLAQNIPLDEFLRYASDDELLAARDRLMNMAEEFENFTDLFDSADQADMRMNDLESEVGRLTRDLLQFQTAMELIEKSHLFAKDIEAGYLTHNDLMQRARWMVVAIDKFNWSDV